MKPTYQGFEAKKSSAFVQLPPPGAYIGEIQDAREDESYDKSRKIIVLMLEITEGEYKGQYHKVYDEQKGQFENVKYRGVLRLTPPVDGDEPWVRRKFEGNLWCVEASNPGYQWDWNEKGLKGKKVGFSVRTNYYTGRDGKDKETTEIAQLEWIEDVQKGNIKPLNPRDQRKKGVSASESGTNVTGEIEVPF